MGWCSRCTRGRMSPMPSFGFHSSRENRRNSWMRSLASNSRATRATWSRVRLAPSRYSLEVYTAASAGRLRPRKASMASRAVAPALSRTPGLKPTHRAQSKSPARGLELETWVTGLVKTSVRTASNSAGVRSMSSMSRRRTRTRSRFKPQYSRALRRKASPSASWSSGRQPISRRTAIGTFREGELIEGNISQRRGAAKLKMPHG